MTQRLPVATTPGLPSPLGEKHETGAADARLTVRSLFRRLTATARLMVGVPDYDAYVRHRRDMHPEEPVMSYEDFFRERQQSRYGTNGGKISRCC